MTETQLLAVRLRADAAMCLARARSSQNDDGYIAWDSCADELTYLADQLEASASEPASTVSDAAIVAQVRLVMELEKECENDCCFEAEHAAAKAQLDAMLKASEVTA